MGVCGCVWVWVWVWELYDHTHCNVVHCVTRRKCESNSSDYPRRSRTDSMKPLQCNRAGRRWKPLVWHASA